MSLSLNMLLFIVVSISVFWLVSQSFMYKITDNVTNLVGWKSSSDGVPNQSGIILHGIVLSLLVLIAQVLLLKK